MDFAPGAAGFHVGQHPFQVAHAHGQGLHFPQALVDLLQPLADQLEGFAQSFFQSPLEFFVHRLTHLLQVLGVVRLDGLEPFFDRGANFDQPFLVGVGKPLQLFDHAAELPPLPIEEIVDSFAYRFVERLQGNGDFLTGLLRTRRRLLSHFRQLLRIVFLKNAKSLLDGFPHLVELLFIALG